MPIEHPLKAADRIRTDDLVLTKDVLYQLSYSSRYCRPRLSHAVDNSVLLFNSVSGRPFFWPELKIAGEGNLNPIVFSLEGMWLYQRSYTDRHLFAVRYSVRNRCYVVMPKFLSPTSYSSRAGEGNRTLVFSLEGCGSTIELHPQILRIQNATHFQRPNARSLPAFH